MQDRPTANELLLDIADLLENQVVPAVAASLRHQVRVAGNLCRIIERELRLGPANDAREAELLKALLGGDSTEVAVLDRRLDERLRTGDDVDFERRAWAALVEVVRGKLAVTKPGHDSYDFAGETAGPPP
jgi:Domain of unknown function (DUF6285)